VCPKNGSKIKSQRKAGGDKRTNREKTHDLLHLFSDILVDCKDEKPSMKLLTRILDKINHHGGAATLHVDCEQAVACSSKNYLLLLWEFYENKRPTLFKLLRTLDIQSTTQNNLLIKAMKTMLENQDEKSEYLCPSGGTV
jgi:hypothetical protein